MFFLCSLPVTLIFAATLCGVTVGSPATTVSIEPHTSAFLPNTVFNVTVSIAEVTNLYGWEFNITYSPTVLHWLSFYEGPFLKQAGDTYKFEPTFNNTAGWISAGRALFPYPENGATGSGILAYLTFNASAEGLSSLHFDVETTNLRTIDQSQMPVVIHFTPVDGSVNVALVHDVAVTSVSVSNSRITIGDDVSITVTVKNNGSVSESFDVTLSYDSTVIEVETVSGLAPGESKSLSFTWSTKDLAPKDYTLNATAGVVSGETVTANNTHDAVISAAAASIISTWLLAGIIVAIVVVLGVVIFIYMRRRSRKT
jgi:hypothetical protein